MANVPTTSAWDWARTLPGMGHRRPNESLEIAVDPAQAREAFLHPYAYAT